MSNQFLSIAESEEFIRRNPDIHSHLKWLIKEAIVNKKMTFSRADVTGDYEILRSPGFLITETDRRFQLNFDSFPVCQVLKEAAEEIMLQRVPENPLEALRFAENFFVEIRKPKTNHHWYSVLEIQFESYLMVWLHQKYGIDINQFIDNITGDMEEEHHFLRSLDITYKDLFPHLNDSVPKMYAVIVRMLNSEMTRHTGLEALQNIGKINPAKTLELYEYIKGSAGSTHPDLFSTLLIGLFKYDEPKYQNEAKELFETEPLESLKALTWFNYSNQEQVDDSFHFLDNKNETGIDYLRILPTFYIRLTENTFASEEVKAKCFDRILEFTRQEDHQLRINLLFRTRMIKGHDEEKYELLPHFLNWGDPSVLHDYFDHFSSPKYIFEILTNSFLEHGIYTNLKLFENTLRRQYFSNRATFETELARLLTSDIPILRHAGVMILTSGRGQAYDFDPVKFAEQDQLTVIDTLLSVPINIEETLPLALKLKNSSFKTVLDDLQIKIIGLIEAYGNGIAQICADNLDISQPNEKNILESLNKAFDDYEQKMVEKAKIREFNPFENELSSIRYYNQLEGEINAEQVNLAQKQSMFNEIAKTMMIIRGSGFTSEGNPNVSPLGQIAISRLIDRRYFINPDKYEYNFKVTINRNIPNTP